jgi:Holliday junction resolvase RusA-like endonuclease
MKQYNFKVTPVGKPTMTQKSKFGSKKGISAYYAFRDQVRLQANVFGLRKLPSSLYKLIFYVPMPKSWPKSKREKLRHHGCESKPDLDNLIKAFGDCFGEDKHIYQITNGVGKYWADEGSILLTLNGNEGETEEYS